MSTVVSEPMILSGKEQPQPAVTILSSTQTEAEFIKCDCCGLTEECTPEYIERVRERYNGKWICGLCTEAVKYEIVRSRRMISTEEALNLHMTFCKKFKALRSSGPQVDPTVHLISAMSHLLRRSFDSPRGLRSTPSSPSRSKDGEGGSETALTRSESCFPDISD